MKKFLFLLLTLLTASLAYSQPGYQGHKFLILYNLNVTPAAATLNSQGQYGINLMHQGKLEYAWRRKFDIGLQGSYLKASLKIFIR